MKPFPTSLSCNKWQSRLRGSSSLFARILLKDLTTSMKGTFPFGRPMVRLIPYWLLAALLSFQSAQADSIFDSLGTGTTWYGYESSWACSPLQQVSDGFGFAVSFTVPSATDYWLTGVSVYVRRSSDPGGPNLLLSIVNDNSAVPGDVILETVAENSPSIGSGSEGVVSFASSLAPVLTAGATYWLRAQPAVFDTSNWINNDAYLFLVAPDANPAPTAIRIYDQAAGWGAWQEGSLGTPAFRIDAVPVPEPGVTALVMCGGLGWLYLRRRRRLPNKANQS